MATQDAQPHNSIVCWQDGDSTFHLLPRDDSVIEKLGQGDPVIDRIQTVAPTVLFGPSETKLSAK
jgi:hypothetical protein